MTSVSTPPGAATMRMFADAWREPLRPRAGRNPTPRYRLTIWPTGWVVRSVGDSRLIWLHHRARNPDQWCDNLGMTQTVGSDLPLAEKVRRALVSHDLQAFGALLSDDVTWGDVGHPRGCRNRSDVLATFGQLLDKGVDGRITELEAGTAGILCGLTVDWAEGDPRASDSSILFHVYIVRDCQICQIRRYDDRDSAARAAGVS